MSLIELISLLNIGAVVFAALAVIAGIAATVITVLYHPFRQPEMIIIQSEEERPKIKKVVTRIRPEDIQTLNSVTEIPKITGTGWIGTGECEVPNE